MNLCKGCQSVWELYHLRVCVSVRSVFSLHLCVGTFLMSMFSCSRSLGIDYLNHKFDSLQTTLYAPKVEQALESAKKLASRSSALLDPLAFLASLEQLADHKLRVRATVCVSVVFVSCLRTPKRVLKLAIKSWSFMNTGLELSPQPPTQETFYAINKKGRPLANSSTEFGDRAFFLYWEGSPHSRCPARHILQVRLVV